MTTPIPAVPKPFRFGIQISGAPDGAAWRDLARRAEDLGYDTLSAADHLDDQFSPIPALVAAADVTSTIRLALMVLCHDYRHPVIAAKDVATLDVLCDGRLDVGIGAGWQTGDYAQAGIPFDAPATRVDRTEEYVKVLKGLWADGSLTHAGEWYRVTDLDGRPKPLQRPHPPLIMGGGGKRMLTIAAREADIVAINIKMVSGVVDASAGPSATAEATDRKLEWIRAAAGERFDELTLQTRIHLAMVTETPGEKDEVAQWASPAVGLTPEQGYETPHALVGTVGQIVEDCERRRERWGISYITLSADAMESFAPVVAALAGR